LAPSTALGRPGRLDVDSRVVRPPVLVTGDRMAAPDASSQRETGKQRAVRIPLDYFKQADALTRWKLRFTALALVLALGWWAIGFVMTDEGRLRYSRGPVAAVH